MTGVALAINADVGAPEYSARDFRNAMAGLSGWDGVPLAGRQGLRPMGGSSANVVTLSGSTITVGLHTAEITPGWSSTTGSYLVALTATENHALNPADVTNPRKDIVVGRVYDDDENPSGLRLYESDYIAGNAGPTPSEPAVPQGAIKLATIDVPADGAGSPVVTVNHTYTVAAGGVLPVRTQAERDAIVDPHPGMVVDRIDKGWLEHYYSGAWRTHRTVVSPGTLADITDPLTGQVVFHTGTRQFWVWTGSQWLRHTPLRHVQPTQTASGNLATGGTGVTVCSVTITDPGFSYYIKASGSMAWASGASPADADKLMQLVITIDSTTYTSNVLGSAVELTRPLNTGFSFPTMHVTERHSSPAFAAFTGTHTVRLIARNSGTQTVQIPANSTETSLSVDVLPVT